MRYMLVVILFMFTLCSCSTVNGLMKDLGLSESNYSEEESEEKGMLENIMDSIQNFILFGDL